MTRPNEFTRPLYAAAGAGDLAVAALRKIPGECQRVQDQLRTVDTDELRTRVDDYTGKAVDAYSGLAARGEKLFGSLRRQRSTTDLVEQVDHTAERARGTRASAKATRTRASKTEATAHTSASKATRAARAGSGKIG